jgi:hypothetical protein
LARGDHQVGHLALLQQYRPTEALAVWLLVQRQSRLQAGDGRNEKLMAILGAQLLETQKRVGETAEAIELRVSGENSILGALAACVGMSLTQVLRWAYWWNSTEAMPDDVSNEDVVIELNTDYCTRGLTANEIVAIVQAWQSGALSRDSMLDTFRRGEVLPEDRPNEEEVRLIAIGKPKPQQQAAPGVV